MRAYGYLIPGSVINRVLARGPQQPETIRWSAPADSGPRSPDELQLLASRQVLTQQLNQRVTLTNQGVEPAAPLTATEVAAAMRALRPRIEASRSLFESVALGLLDPIFALMQRPGMVTRDRLGHAAIRELAEDRSEWDVDLQWTLGVHATIDLDAPDWREQIHRACDATSGGDQWPDRATRATTDG